MPGKNSNVVWKTLEYKHAHKDPDWFWGIGIVAVSIAVISILTGNPLFGVLIIIGAITLFLHAIKRPEPVEVRVLGEGLFIGEHFFSFEELVAFCIYNENDQSHVIFKSKRLLTPRIVVPLEKTKEHDARRALAPHLPEEKLEIPISHRIVEFLGL